METECADCGANGQMSIADRANAMGMEKVTIMLGHEEPAYELSYIERALITQFPLSGLMIEVTDAGVNVWGMAENIEIVRTFFDGGIDAEILLAEKRLEELLAGNSLDPTKRDVRNADTRVRDLKTLALIEWY
jgi:hypothetical protein